MKKSLLALFFGLLFIIAFLWSNLTLPAVNITPWVGTNDFTDGYYPWYVAYSRSIQNGNLLLWISSLSGGYPLFAAAIGMLYPVNLLSTFLPPLTAVNGMLVLDYFLIFVLSFAYLRKINLGREAGFFGALLTTFGGFSANQIIYPEVLTTFYLILAQLYVLEVFLQGKGKNFVWILVSGLILGLNFATGHPQYIFYAFLFLLPYWAVFWLRTGRRRGLFFLHLTVVVVLGLGIGMVQILPKAEFTLASTRAGGLSQQAINRFNLPFLSIVTFVNPFALVDQSGTQAAFNKNGWPADSQYLYMGILGLTFVVLGLVRVIKFGRYAVFFTLAAIGALIFSFGNQFPIIGQLLNLPPFSFFRIPFKILFVLNFSLGVLAAYSFDWFLKKVNLQKWVKWAVVGLIFTLTFADLKINSEKLHPPVDAKTWYREPEVAFFLKEKLVNQERVVTQAYYAPSLKIFLGKPELWNKAETLVNLRNLLPAYNAFMYDIPLNVGLANAGALKINRYNELEVEIFYKGILFNKDGSLVQVNDTFMFLNRLTGAKYAIFAQPVEKSGLKKVFETNFSTGQDQISVYEISDPYPRVFLVPQAEKAQPLEIKNHLLAGDFNPKEKVFIEENDVGNKDSRGQDFSGSAQFEKYSDLEVVVKTQSQGSGFLFLSDSYYPGWKATVDGKETKILRANYAFRAMAVPEGEHRVVFEFKPKSFDIGLKVSLATTAATLIMIAALFVLSFLKKKN